MEGLPKTLKQVGLEATGVSVTSARVTQSSGPLSTHRNLKLKHGSGAGCLGLTHCEERGGKQDGGTMEEPWVEQWEGEQ